MWLKIYLVLLVLMVVVACWSLVNAGNKASAAMGRSDATLEQMEDQVISYRSAVAGLRRAIVELTEKCNTLAAKWGKEQEWHDLYLRRKRGK